MEALKVRSMTDEDMNLILSTWLRDYYHSSLFARCVNKDLFFHYHELAIRKILLRSQTKPLIACDAADPYVVYGYFIFEDHGADSVLHYAYVKQPLRGEGIFRMLLDHSDLDMRLPLEYTHQVRDYDKERGARGENPWKKHWLYEKFPDLVHNPYKL